MNEGLPFQKIELRDQGGIAQINNKITIEGQSIQVIHRRKPPENYELPPEAAETLTNLVRSLESVNPRLSYGRSLVSDPMETSLYISKEPKSISITVTSDPHDVPPSEFEALIKQIHEYAHKLV